MKSINEIEFNNPGICIKGKSTFACVCPECMELYKQPLGGAWAELEKLAGITDEQTRTDSL